MKVGENKQQKSEQQKTSFCFFCISCRNSGKWVMACVACWLVLGFDYGNVYLYIKHALLLDCVPLCRLVCWM